MLDDIRTWYANDRYHALSGTTMGSGLLLWIALHDLADKLEDTARWEAMNDPAVANLAKDLLERHAKR